MSLKDIIYAAIGTVLVAYIVHLRNPQFWTWAASKFRRKPKITAQRIPDHVSIIPKEPGDLGL